jgi:hypothetical protein
MRNIRFIIVAIISRLTTSSTDTQDLDSVEEKVTISDIISPRNLTQSLRGEWHARTEICHCEDNGLNEVLCIENSIRDTEYKLSPKDTYAPNGTIEIIPTHNNIEKRKGAITVTSLKSALQQVEQRINVIEPEEPRSIPEPEMGTPEDAPINGPAHEPSIDVGDIPNTSTGTGQSATASYQ